MLLERKAARLRKATGNPNYRSKLASDLTARELFQNSIIRPLKMLICCPIVTVMCTYIAILYGILYLLFATYSFVFREVYSFSTSGTGLVFIAGGIGTLIGKLNLLENKISLSNLIQELRDCFGSFFLLKHALNFSQNIENRQANTGDLAGLFYIGYLSDRILRKREAAGKIIVPEDRLPLVITIPGALSFPIGLFVYGWSAQEHTQWIIPQIGTAITGFGAILIFICIQTYLIDAFVEHAASVIGANAVFRGIAGALVPLAGLKMYDNLGWAWGNSTLGFIALAFAPLPLIFGRYGAKIRSFKYTSG